jgi:hypothetical protein
METIWNGSPRCEAGRLLSDPKGSDGVKKRKWAAGEGRTQGKKARNERN